MDNATALKALEYWRETLIENERLRVDIADGRRRELAMGNEAAKQALENRRLRSALVQIEDVSFEADDALGTCIKIAQRALNGSTGGDRDI